MNILKLHSSPNPRQQGGRGFNMRVLDLFSGLGGWSAAFVERGHEVVTVDMEERFKPTFVRDMNDVEDLKEFGTFDVILASPPCNCFSIAAVYRHWDKNTGLPKDIKTYDAVKLTIHTIQLIELANPKFYIIENPRGMMRKVLGTPALTTTFAAWQSEKERIETIKAFHDKRKPALKPTDLWGRLPPSFKNQQPTEWASAPRGSSLGTQGLKDSAMRAKIPYGLSLAMCEAAERDLA